MSESVAVIAWGAAQGGRREHAYRTYPEAAWWPTNHPPRSLCGTAQSPERGVVPAEEGLQRCGRCVRITAQQVESGMARSEPTVEGSPLHEWWEECGRYGTDPVTSAQHRHDIAADNILGGAR